MSSATIVIMVANAITVVLGGTITLLALRAYRRTRVQPMRVLAIGIALVTAGTALGGILHQFTATSLLMSVATQSVFIAAGFVILFYSLWMIHGSTPTRSRLSLP